MKLNGWGTFLATIGLLVPLVVMWLDFATGMNDDGLLYLYVFGAYCLGLSSLNHESQGAK